jgi:PilZ domain-containing protein
MTDRRRHQRVRLRTPVRGAVGASRVYVTDGSVAGMGIAHQGTLPPPGGICRIELASDWGPIRVDCQVVRTVERVMTQTQRPIFHSGLQIVVMDHQSAQRLQTMFEAVSGDDF